MDVSRLESIGTAAAGIAHDINNELTLMLNYLALADLAGVQAAVERCSALTGGLLAYCKGEPVALISLDPAEFLKRYVSELHLPATIAVVLEAPDGLPAIAGDPTAITRALTNLILNACFAMHGSGTLRIAASPRLIEITDSGPGVPPENARRVFEPFFTTKGGFGNGLGLSIVKEIMREHGGSVELHCEPGRGARFTLRFRAYCTTGFSTSPRRIAPAA